MLRAPLTAFEELAVSDCFFKSLSQVVITSLAISDTAATAWLRFLEQAQHGADIRHLELHNIEDHADADLSAFLAKCLRLLASLKVLTTRGSAAYHVTRALANNVDPQAVAVGEIPALLLPGLRKIAFSDCASELFNGQLVLGMLQGRRRIISDVVQKNLPHDLAEQPAMYPVQVEEADIISCRYITPASYREIQQRVQLK